MTLDAKLRWKEHVKKKREEFNIKYRKIYWLIRRSSILSIYNKLLIHKQILNLYGHMGSSCEDVPEKATLTSSRHFKTKSLETMSMHRGMLEIMTSIAIWEWKQ